MGDISEFVWNLRRLIRDAFPQGLPIASLEAQYTKFFSSCRLPKPESVDPSYKTWLLLFKRDNRFQEWFCVTTARRITVKRKPERDLEVYFRLNCYTQYLSVRQGAKVEGLAVSDIESDEDEKDEPDFERLINNGAEGLLVVPQADNEERCPEVEELLIRRANACVAAVANVSKPVLERRGVESAHPVNESELSEYEKLVMKQHLDRVQKRENEEMKKRKEQSRTAKMENLKQLQLMGGSRRGKKKKLSKKRRKLAASARQQQLQQPSGGGELQVAEYYYPQFRHSLNHPTQIRGCTDQYGRHAGNGLNVARQWHHSPQTDSRVPRQPQNQTTTAAAVARNSSLYDTYRPGPNYVMGMKETGIFRRKDEPISLSQNPDRVPREVNQAHLEHTTFDDNGVSEGSLDMDIASDGESIRLSPSKSSASQEPGSINRQYSGLTQPPLPDSQPPPPPPPPPGSPPGIRLTLPSTRGFHDIIYLT